MKFKIGDKVKLVQGLTERTTGITQNELDELYLNNNFVVADIEDDGYLCIENKHVYGYWVSESQLELITYNMKLRIKYFEGATKLQKIAKGNWIDVYANKDMFIPVGERAMIPLGFALELPQGWECHLAPRSSTFKTWGIIQTNSVGVVDDTYIGDNDQWRMPVYCLQGKGYKYTEEHTLGCFENLNNVIVEENDKCKIYSDIRTKAINDKGTWIRKGDKIGQFRIMEVMPSIDFEEVESFGNADRNGFGSTGTK